MASKENGSGSFKTGFVLGAIIGAAAGLLLAPKTGQEMRADLMEQSEALRARAEELAAKARDQLGPAIERARERLGPAVEAARDRIGPLVEQVGSGTAAATRGESMGGNGGPGERDKA